MNVSLPEGISDFLTMAGWPAPTIEPLPGDASFRRYFRIRAGAASAMLMHAPPPHEDPAPFLRVAHWLDDKGMRAPRILAQDLTRGFVLLEDFGDDRMRDHLDARPEDEDAIYTGAVDALIALGRLGPGPFPEYSMSEYLREARLFVEWFCPAMQLDVDTQAYDAAWQEALAPMLVRQTPGVVVLRDYHAENIMLLGSSGEQGLLDFQDALIGHPAYDLVSLLQDARRDVSPALERRMLDHYLRESGAGPDFEADYARLGAQRNAKIVGIFTRLCKRDGKPRYLSLIPRVWEAMERDLAHPALAPVAAWFDLNIPRAIRDARGEGIA